MPDQTTVQFQIRLGAETFDAEATVPSQPLRLADLIPLLWNFNDAVIAHSAESEAGKGFAVSCRAGCGACCRQLVPMAEAEAIALAEWIAGLPDADQQRIRARFDQALAALGSDLVARLRGHDSEDLRQLGLDYFRAAVPCPFLVNESCGVYNVRPMKCREYLVTSPAEYCAEPSAEKVVMVPVPVSFASTMARFGSDRPKWLPLVLVLEWYERHRADDVPSEPGAELLHDFVSTLAK